MKMNIFFKKAISASIWSIMAQVVINIITQFVVYPYWAEKFDSEYYGNIIFAMSIFNIVAISIGISLNYGRMQESALRTTNNGDYNTILFACGIIGAIGGCIILGLTNFLSGAVDAVLCFLLCFSMIIRYYIDVEYRLKINYKGYFKFYFSISIGYLVGIVFLTIVPYWQIPLLFGEILGIIYLYLTSTVLKFPLSFDISSNFKQNMRVFFFLFGTNFISNLVFNGDRIIIELFWGGEIVSLFYISSLVGKTMSLITTPLNTVLIGFLSRYKKGLNKKILGLVALVGILCIMFFSIVNIIGSNILVPILYPSQYQEVRPYFFAAGLGAILYFLGNTITTILVRFADAKYQLFINIIYSVAFLITCFPVVFWTNNLRLLCYMIACANLIRLVVAFLLLSLCMNNPSKYGLVLPE